MRRRYKITALAGAGLIALLSQLPAQPILKTFAGDAVGPDASASGTVWNGQVTGAAGLGPISYTASLSRLLSGRAPIEARTQMPGISISGSAGHGRLSDLSFSGKIWTFSNVDPRLSGLEGDFSAVIETLTYDSADPEAGCTSATGRAQSDVLQSNQARLSWRGPKVAGPISCEAGALMIALSGEGDGQSVTLNFKVFPDGRYENQAGVQTRDPNAQAVMALFGFMAAGNVYTLNETGRWQ